MFGSAPGLWLDRLAESLREHEDRKTSIEAYPPRYEVLGEISRGGMGIIYRAWDPQLGRNVALKVLRTEEGRDAQVHERFQREAQLAAGLHHPHIVQVFDTGTWNGQDYIAMQLIEGTTLDQAKIDRKQALAAVRDAARALHYAHEQGIVHRDVKPTNLLLEPHGRVYVTDFGVARQAVVSSTLTSPGTIVGTPAYMSPEQAQGLATDARSDVYSLGATLYELMTGRPPFDSDDAVAVVEAVRARGPLPPRKRAPDLSKNVEAIILGAMERAREDRYASAAEMADDIDRYLSGERPLRRARGVTYRVRREFVRHPWRSWAAILFCALLLTAGITLGYAIRGYLYLNRARQATDPGLQKQYFRIAERWFPEAGQELARIEREDSTRKNDENRKIEVAEAARIYKVALESSKKELTEKDRKTTITQLESSAIKSLEDGRIEDARKAVDAILTFAPEKHAELLPRLRKKEFEAALAKLIELAAKPDEASFEFIYETLRGPTYDLQKDRPLRLSKPLLQLALKLKDLKRPAEALRWLDEAEHLGAQEAALYEQRGLVLLELQHWDRAQGDLDSLMKRSAGRAVYPSAFAQLSYREGHQSLIDRNWTRVFQQFEFTLHFDPKHAMAYHDRGLARYYSTGQAREALEEDLKSALSSDPSLIPDRQYQEVVLKYARAQAERLWRVDEAKDREAAWREALSWLTLIRGKTGDSGELALERARMNRRLRAYPAGLEDLKHVPEGPVSARFRGELRYLLSFAKGKDANELGEALKDFETAVRLDPQDSLSLYWRGTCRHVLRDLAGAMEDLTAARALGLDLPDLHHQLSRIHLDLKQHALAVECASTALGRAESLSEDEYVSNLYENRNSSRSAGLRFLERDILFCRALARFYLNDFRNCSDDCARVVVLDAQFHKAYLLRGDAACRDKRHADAQRDYATVATSTATREDKESAMQRKENCLKHPKE